MQLLVPLLSILAFSRTTAAQANAPPSKIYGVNLGSWLLLEPWMLPNEWERMGGQTCADCSTCIASEFALAAAYPDDVDERFAGHWSTWFTQQDVNQLQDAGINTVRIPLGYWIVEPLVDREIEHYPRGGIKYLVNGLNMLRKAGIRVILDHHALPGVQAVNQMFTGNCTNTPQFYTDYNYGRALIWTAVMTFLTQLHPDFESVFSIEAVNEPLMNATRTPGLGEFGKNFVRTVRAMECLIGVNVLACQVLQGMPNAANLPERLIEASATDALGLFSPPVVEALTQSLPMLSYIAQELEWVVDFTACRDRPLITTKLVFPSFMDILWQYNDPANPLDAAIGPQAYDHHLYYNFGGVAAPDPEAYMRDICSRNDTQKDVLAGNTPLWYGEWALSTQFNATDDFLIKWADAQKLMYSQGAGWLFWSLKIESTSPYARQMSYFEGLERGYLTKDPAQFHDPNVCVPYRNSSDSSTTS
ncbi:glycoside hydrolase family 5 protein [Russula earlei]|uniref:Glycoside hydrolase family 5 protein n=1 Tax=Russula earlei TaxID=71964 RepID=A0ACC0UDG5_9AGAM|nr:glycoside hydrolase family 5 protein [Russula earlei]